jgi:hypothetical protein
MIKQDLSKRSVKSQEVKFLSKQHAFIFSQMELSAEAARMNLGDSDFGIESCDLNLSCEHKLKNQNISTT